MGLHLPLQPAIWALSARDHRDQRAHGGGVGRDQLRRAGAAAGPRSAGWIGSALAATSRRRARFSAAVICDRVSRAAAAGIGARVQQLQRVGGGQIVEGLQRGREVLPQRRAQPQQRAACVPRSSVWCARATTLTPSASALSPATGRSWWASVRTMSASTCASPASLLAPEVRVPLAVPGHLQRVDREHPVAGRDQRRDPRATVGLDPDQHLPGPASSSAVGELRRSARAAGRSRPRPPGSRALPSRRPVVVLHLHVVVVLGPVIADEQHHRVLPPRPIHHGGSRGRSPAA